MLNICGDLVSKVECNIIETCSQCMLNICGDLVSKVQCKIIGTCNQGLHQPFLNIIWSNFINFMLILCVFILNKSYLILNFSKFLRHLLLIIELGFKGLEDDFILIGMNTLKIIG